VSKDPYRVHLGLLLQWKSIPLIHGLLVRKTQASHPFPKSDLALEGADVKTGFASQDLQRELHVQEYFCDPAIGDLSCHKFP